MQRKVPYLFAALILLTPLFSSASQPAVGATEADVLWMQIEGLVAQHRQAAEKARAEARNSEGATRGTKQTKGVLPPAKAYQVRELALEFYEAYPNDPRSTALRRAFLSINHTDPFDPFSSAVSRVKAHEKRAAEGYWDLNAKVDALLELAADAQVPDGKVSRELYLFHNIARDVHPTVDELRTIYARLKASSNDTLRQVVGGRERFLALSDLPLELKLPTTDGSVIDLKELRGKVVLLDIWSRGCSSCIASMPKMQTLYEKYRGRGFELVGVHLNSHDSPEKQAEQTAAGTEIMKKQGATWTDAVMVGKKTVREFMRRYSVSAVPQLWLLDQTGRLALEVDVGSDFVGPRAGESRIEKEIKRLLGDVSPATAGN